MRELFESIKKKLGFSILSAWLLLTKRVLVIDWNWENTHWAQTSTQGEKGYLPKFRIFFCIQNIIQIFISPDKSRGFTGFTSLVPPPYVLTYMCDNSKNAFKNFIQTWHRNVFGSGEKPFVRRISTPNNKEFVSTLRSEIWPLATLCPLD